MTTETRFDALVSAGGFAYRCGSGHPKSLLFAGEKTMLELTVDGLISAGCKSIIVSNNRCEWHNKIIQIIGGRPEVVVLRDPGYLSTYNLVLQFSNVMENRFLFAYGHAPRPPELFAAVRCVEAPIGAASFLWSTKTRTVRWGNRFLEPPFLVNKEMLHGADGWCAFFRNNMASVGVVDTDDIPEFNYDNEVENYKIYAKSLYMAI